MQGVTTAIVLYVFVCLVFPRLIRHKPQFYVAFGLMLLIILLSSWAMMFGGVATGQAGAGGSAQAASSGGSGGAIYGLVGLMQIGAVILLALSTSGMTPQEMREDIGKTIEVIRRGSVEKETIIVPLRGADSEPATPTKPAPPPRKPHDTSIPLDD